MNRYNSDVFVEYMVKKKMGSKDLLLILASIFGGLIIFMLGLFILPSFLGAYSGQFIFFILVGVIFGIYFVFTRLSLEFEYAVTNGDLTVDKIMARKTRKRLTSFDAKNIEEMGKYPENAEKLKNKSVDKTIFAGVYGDGRESVYIIAKSNKTGRTLLVFDPSERVLEAIKYSVPREVRIGFYGR